MFSFRLILQIKNKTDKPTFFHPSFLIMYNLERTPYKLRDWIDINKIDCQLLSLNRNAIYLLEQSQDKIDWSLFSSNRSIFEIDYTFLNKRIEPFKEELIQRCFHPDRLIRYLETYHYDIGEDEYQKVFKVSFFMVIKE